MTSFFGALPPSNSGLKQRVVGYLSANEGGLVCDGVKDDTSALQTWVASLSDRAVTLVVFGPTLITQDITIPSTLPVRFEGNGAFTGSGTVTYTAWNGGATGPRGPKGDSGDIAPFTSTGSTTARGSVDRWAEVRNVRDFGALGDNSHDDTSNFQAAFDAYVRNVQYEFPQTVIWIPAGKYKITAPINLNGRSFYIAGEGCGSILAANFNDFVFTKTDETQIVWGSAMRDFQIQNSHATGGGIRMNGTNGLLMENLIIQAQRGFLREANNFTTNMVGCFLNKAGTYAGSYGIKSIFHLNVVGCDFHNYEIGCQFGGFNINVWGGRTEVCGTAFLLGRSYDGTAMGFGGGSIRGHYFEACDTVIDVQSAAYAVISENFFDSTTNSPSGDPMWGIKVASGNGLVIERNSIGAQFSKAAMYIGGGNTSVELRHNRFTNGHPSGYRRLLDAAYTTGLTLTDTPAPPEVVARLGNRKASAVTVTGGATYLDVAFPVDSRSSQYSGTISTAVAGSGGSLAAGNYYYLGTYVNEAGELYPAAGPDFFVRNVTVGASGKVTINFAGTTRPSGVWKRRVFRARGTWPVYGAQSLADMALFDGYYDLAPGADGPWEDTGAAFTYQASPRLGDHAELGWPEADTNYRVNVRPAWNTTWWITGTATTGFRINFGTAPVGDSTLDWEVVR